MAKKGARSVVKRFIPKHQNSPMPGKLRFMSSSSTAELWTDGVKITRVPVLEVGG